MGGYGVTTGAQSDTDGQLNTTTITDKLGDNGGVLYAAKLCAEYEIDALGNTPCETPNVCYKDWGLPAKTQLNCLGTYREEIGNFADAPYLASTEFTSSPLAAAWGQSILFELQIGGLFKNELYRVRCVRTFTV